MSGPLAGGASGSVTAPEPRDLDTFDAVAAAARAGLLAEHKSLPAWLLYDEVGSALFEDITRLPEYYLTRTERAILTVHAPEIVEAVGPPFDVVELGAGSASKTRLVLDALQERQPRVRYTPVDVSRTALLEAASKLRDLRRVDVEPVEARYPEELGFLRHARGRRLVMFLGSNVGNYDFDDARALLAAVRRHLAPGDALLLGADRRKSPSRLLPAYDDAAGVTARFSKNVLVRLNRELGATFDLDRFAHVVVWNAHASRLELYLESTVAQRVTVRALGLEVAFAAHERIHTESSYKLTDERLRRLVVDSGFVPEATWSDERRWFGVHLARVPAPNGLESRA